MRVPEAVANGVCAKELRRMKRKEKVLERAIKY
jgi:hypothetical protein